MDERKISTLALGPVFDPNLPDEEALILIDKFLEDKRDVLSGKDRYVGGWMNPKTGKFCLDASENFQGINEVMTSAASTHQHGVFNLNDFNTIYVGEWLEEHPDFVVPAGTREWYRANPPESQTT